MTAGALRWGVRASFLDYLRGLDDGEIAASDGAVFDGTECEFPLSDAAGAGPGRGVLEFGGSARFRGHGGMLDLVLAAPHLDLDAGALTVAGEGRRIPVATVELGVIGAEWTSAPTRLTREGAALLNDVYRAGEALDPVRVWIDWGRR